MGPARLMGRPARQSSGKTANHFYSAKTLHFPCKSDIIQRPAGRHETKLAVSLRLANGTMINMKRTSVVTILLAVVAICFAVSPRQLSAGPLDNNLLTNFGFEIGQTNPKGWRVSPVASGDLDFEWDNTVSANGEYSVSITSSSDTAVGKWCQLVPVTGGTVYEYSGSVRFDTLASGSCYLQVAFRNETSVLRVHDYRSHSGTRLEFGVDFPDRVKVRAPQGAVAAKIQLVLEGSGKVWFDNIFFATVPLGDIAGTVTSYGQPLEGAQVNIMGEPWDEKYESLSDANGNYIIENVPLAHPRYVVIASKQGYKCSPAGDIDIVPQDVVNVDFELIPGIDPGDLSVSFAVINERFAVTREGIGLNDVIPADVNDYPLSVRPFLKSNEYIDSNHPRFVALAGGIVNSVGTGQELSTQAVVNNVFKWVVTNIERTRDIIPPGEGADLTPEFCDVTTAKWQLFSQFGWAWGHDLRNYLHKASDLFIERGGTCSEMSIFSAALLRALKIPAIPCGGSYVLYWVQDPSGVGHWAMMDVAYLGRTNYRDNGRLIGRESPYNPLVYSIADEPIVSAYWNMTEKSLFNKRGNVIAYEYSPEGMAQAISNLESFTSVEVPPHLIRREPHTLANQRDLSDMYTTLWTSFTIRLWGIEQEELVVRFTIPDANEINAFWAGYAGYQTNHPELVTDRWIEETTNPPAEGTDIWFCIAFDLVPLLE